MNKPSGEINYFKYPILIVDDDKDLLYSFEKEFKDTFTVFTANSVKEGLDILEKENIAVILVDQRMPVTTGINLIKTAKEKYPSIIRMLVTAYSDIEVVIEAINEGKIYSYISKPWKNEEITDTIKKGIHLYHLSEERDRLYEEKLDAMKKLARANRLNAAISMASGFSDRLNNYLVAIKFFFDSFPERMEKIGGQLSKESKEILNTLYSPSRNNVDKMVNLSREIGTLLTSPKYDFQKYDAKTIIDLVDKVKENLKSDTKGKNITIAGAIENNPPAVYFDTKSISQVLYHLLQNAIHAIPETKKGSILIKISGPIYKNGRDFTRIIVQDNGNGISEQNIENVFNPFFTTKGTAGGIGLGLTTCQFIITHHDGEIEIASSKIGEGTTIHIDLPIRDKPPENTIDYNDVIGMFPNRGK